MVERGARKKKKTSRPRRRVRIPPPVPPAVPKAPHRGKVSLSGRFLAAARRDIALVKRFLAAAPHWRERLTRRRLRRLLLSLQPLLPLVLLGVYLVGYGIFTLARRPPGRLYLAPVREAFFHDEFAEWTLRTDDGPLRAALKNRPLWTWVERDGAPVTTVGGIERMPLLFDEKKDLWRARWPVPWNAPDGVYRVRLDTAAVVLTLPVLHARPFKVASRPFEPMPPGTGVLTLESLGALDNLPAPDGTRKDLTALVEWAEFIGADALCVQGGESTGHEPGRPDHFPWHARSTKSLRALGQECHRRGLKLGVYGMCYLVGGPAETSPDYAYGWTYSNGRLVNGRQLSKRRGVSIADPKRPGDIVALLSRWRDMPEVDFVGLDYIRPVFGGYELVDDFVREMPVEIPSHWASLSAYDRMMWLLDKRVRGSNAFRDMWYWYRAHRSAGIVRSIKSALDTDKPLWAFTLSWEKGWHHGQDPVMMRDAGVDQDAIMLYEANAEQFREIVRQWRGYATRKQVNLLIGDTIDWVLHQRTLNPAGPEDFYNRYVHAMAELHADGPVQGLFIHDFFRAWRGRLGPYSTREWMLAGGAALTRLRELHDRLTYRLQLDVPDTARPNRVRRGALRLATGPSAGAVTVRLYAAPDVEVWPEELELSPEAPEAEFQFRWVPYEPSAARGYRSFVAARAQRLDKPGERCQIHIKYFQGSKALPRPPTPAQPEPELPFPLEKHLFEEEPEDAPPGPAPEDADRPHNP